MSDIPIKQNRIPIPLTELQRDNSIILFSTGCAGRHYLVYGLAYNLGMEKFKSSENTALPIYSNMEVYVNNTTAMIPVMSGVLAANSFLTNPKTIVFKTKNLLRQSIDCYLSNIGKLTNVYKFRNSEKVGLLLQRVKDFDISTVTENDIRTQYNQILTTEKEISEFIEKRGLDYITIYREDVMSDYEGTLVNILKYLNVSVEVDTTIYINDVKKDISDSLYKKFEGTILD